MRGLWNRSTTPMPITVTGMTTTTTTTAMVTAMPSQSALSPRERADVHRHG